MEIHNRIRELRQERSLKLKDVAERSGLTISYLSELERGRIPPTLKALGKLAQGYGISVRVVLHGTCEHEASPCTPPGLTELLRDPLLGATITPDWVQTLSRIEMRGKRPHSKEDWYLLYRLLAKFLDR